MEKHKILVVDDEKGFTAMLKLNLESTGSYDVWIENDSSNALTATLQFHPDLILLDVIMPNVEGPDVAFMVRQQSQLKNIPIIFLTATVTKEEIESQGGVIGGHPFVAKPSSLATLLNSIEKNLTMSSRF